MGVIMKKTFLIISTIFIFLFSSCFTPMEPEFQTSMRELTGAERQSIEAGNAFGIDLFREMSKQEEGENLFISPLSISIALGMALNGAQGETYDEIRNVLKHSGLPLDEINKSYQGLMALFPELDPTVTLDIANSTWYREGFRVEPDFIERLENYFDAEVIELDFNKPEAVDIINDWIAQKTNDLIQEVIEAIDPATMMYLINAIYFKGSWTAEFDPDDTRDDYFTRDDGSKIPIKMMEQENDFHFFRNDRFQAIDMPYGDELFSMTIILPREGKSVDDLASDLTEEQWNEWMNSFPEEKRGIRLMLPRFTMEYDNSLVEVLKTLGMKRAFDHRADFSGINPAIRITDVKHHTFLKVDEEGTEAAAVTVIEFGIISGSGPTLVRVDRPFLLAIREHHSGSVLFIGKVYEPESE